MVESFETKLRKIEVSGGGDGPESGLDGLMQAIVCQRTSLHVV